MPNKLEPDGVDGETGSPREPKAWTMWAEMDLWEAREKPGEQELLLAGVPPVPVGRRLWRSETSSGERFRWRKRVLEGIAPQ